MGMICQRHGHVGALTNMAVPQELIDIFMHSRPVNTSGQKLKGLRWA